MFTTGQANAGTVAALMCVMPPGPCLVAINNVSSVTVYVGPGTALTATNGFPIAAGQAVAWNGYPAGGGGALNVIAASGTANPVGFLVSGASFQTGP